MTPVDAPLSIDRDDGMLQSLAKADAVVAPAQGMGVEMAPDIDFELRLGFLVHDISRLRRSVIDRVVRPLGVTRSQWWVLAFLSREDGMHQVALADELDLGKVALGSLLDPLTTARLIERRADPGDKRIKRVFLTEKGIRLVQTIRENVADVERRLLQGIAKKDLEATVRALRAMKGNISGVLAEVPEED